MQEQSPRQRQQPKIEQTPKAPLEELPFPSAPSEPARPARRAFMRSVLGPLCLPGIPLLAALLLLLTDAARQQPGHEFDVLFSASSGGSTMAADPVSSPVGQTATFSVASTPEGATVLVDFDSVGVTPLDAHTLAPGVYILSLRGARYTPLDTVVFVKADQPARFSFALADADPAAPSEAQEQPRRPAATPPSGPDSEHQPASRPPPSEQTLTQKAPARQVQPGAQEERAPRLGELRITSEPSGASVWLNDQPMGKTPLVLRHIAPGTYEVRLHRGGYEPYSTAVTLRAGQTRTVSPALGIRHW